MQNNNYNHHPNQQNHQEQRGFRNECSVVDESAGNKIAPELNNCESEESVMLGAVTDCVKLNVRENPSMDAVIVCEIPMHTEVIISDKESTDDFYKVYTDSGVDGFCMKKYITVHP